MAKRSPISISTVEIVRSVGASSTWVPATATTYQIGLANRRCIALATGDAINVEDLPPEITQATRLPPGEEAPQGLVGDLERIERNTLLNALKETGWNVSRAARILGVGRTALQYKMKKYGLKKPE